MEEAKLIEAKREPKESKVIEAKQKLKDLNESLKKRAITIGKGKEKGLYLKLGIHFKRNK
jgi:hypothetical protein